MSELLGPEALTEIIASYKLAASLHAMVELDVPAVLVTGALTAAELGERLGVNVGPLDRVLRLLVSRGALSVAAGRYGNSGLTEWLSDDHARHMFLGWQALPALVSAWSGLAPALRSGCTPFEAVHGSDLHSYFAEHPEDAALYEAAMGSTLEDFQEFADAVDLADRSTVVFVGAASGMEVVPILRRWSQLRGVLVDLPRAMTDAPGVLATHALTHRVAIVGGDARFEVPPGDAYVLSTVLRCLSDDDAIAMLSACRAAALPGAVLHVVEMPLPDGAPQHPHATADVTAWVAYGGADRTIVEWGHLHESAGWRSMTVTPLKEPWAILSST